MSTPITTASSLNIGSSILYFLDLFGKKLNIQIAGKEKQTTLTGSILGMLSIISISILSFNFIADLIFRANVNIMYKQERDMIPQNNLTETPMLFGLLDGDGRLIDKRMYDINVQLLSYNLKFKEDGSSEIDYKTVNIPYTLCDINKSFGEYKNLFKFAPYLNELYCITPNSHNFTLFGKYADIKNGFSYLNFYVNKCNNKTNSGSDKICLSSDEIDYKLTNVYFFFISLDNEINHNNSIQVYKKVIKSSSFLMSSKIHKRYYYYIRQVIYNTDYGFVFEDYNKEVFYQQDNYQFEDKLPDDSSTSPSNVGTFSVINENKVDIYYRSYEKIQNIIGNIGGVVELILLTASIINYLLTRNYSSLVIINSIFDFDESEKENTKANIHIIQRHFFSVENPSLHTSKNHLNSNFNVFNNSNTKNNVEVNTCIKNSHSKILSNSKFNFEKKENSNIKNLSSDIK